MTSEKDVFMARLEVVSEALSDGFHLRDLAVVLREAIELADRFGNMTGSGKRELAISFVKEVVARTDGPGPDLLLDPILEAIAPALIDLLVAATKGDLYVNREEA
jgi:hypothetical protein